MINDLGTSYIFNDVQTNSVGFAVKNTIYPVQKILFILFYVRVWKNYIVTVREELYRYSKERENIEYCKNIKEYLNQHSELYPDADVLADFFDNGSNEEDINLNN